MFTVILCSFLVGVAVTLLLEIFVLRRWFVRQPVLGPAYRQQYSRCSLPPDLKDLLLDPETWNKKETCLNLNLIIQFLFRELKDTKALRKWVIKKMNVEFEEMLSTTTGRLLDQLSVRDFNLGKCFPIVKSAALKNVVSKDENETIDELDIMVDITYDGGFELAVDVDLVLGKSAYLAIKVTKLSGTARLQLSRLPYTHWSFSFYEEPVLEFQVESQFEGRPLPQITSFIVNQIRRTVRKKHTLPGYKIRYKPFFTKPEPEPPCQDVYLNGQKLSTGQLEICVVECDRIMKMSGDTSVFCTVAIDSLPWVELISSRKKLWISRDVEIVKHQAGFIGLTFKEEFLLDKYEDVVVVETVYPNTPASQSDVKQNDVLVSVGGIRVTSSKQAAKLMKQAQEKFSVRIERSQSKRTSVPDFRVEEDTISLKEVQADLVEGDPGNEDEMEEYINISIKPSDMADLEKAEKNTGSQSSKDKFIPTVAIPKEEKMPSGSPPKKGFSFLSSGSGIFHRRKNKSVSSNNDRASPKSSPEMKRKVMDFGTVHYDKKETSIRMSPPVSRKEIPKIDHLPTTKNDSSSSLSKTDSRETLKPDASFSSVSSSRSIMEIKKKDSQDSLKLRQPTDGATSGESDREDSDDRKSDNFDMRKTRSLKMFEDLTWNEKFMFEVEEHHKYVNVCLWCKIPEKLDKQNRVIKAEKDVLIGHLSVALMDVALECLSTIQGDLQRTFKLNPSEAKAGASRSKVSNLSSHSGFDEKLCYGDITLAFRHFPQPITNHERKSIVRKHVEGVLSGSEQDKSSESLMNNSRKRVKLEEGQHDFVSTQFQSATYCNFCGKKIWFKSAFQCRLCGMICHKKCIDRGHAQTICSKDGFQWKSPPPVPPSPKVEKEKEKVQLEENKEHGGEALKEVAPHKSLLNKFRRRELPQFRKDHAKRSAGGSPKGVQKVMKMEPSSDSSPEPGRRRRSSLPSDDNASLKSIDAPGGKISLELGGVQRTRSSTSIQDLMEQENNNTAAVQEVESDNSSSDYSDEDEMNLLRYFEQQKLAQHSDELVVTAAKEMGKELYANLSPEERRNKLDAMVSKFQQEIDEESENRAELARIEKEATDHRHKSHIRHKIAKSDEKIQALALLMLHYCAGLQHCLDQEELERQKKVEEEQRQEESEQKNAVDVQDEEGKGNERNMEAEPKVRIVISQSGSVEEMADQTSESKQGSHAENKKYYEDVFYADSAMDNQSDKVSESLSGVCNDLDKEIKNNESLDGLCDERSVATKDDQGQVKSLKKNTSGSVSDDADVNKTVVDVTER